MSFDPVERKRAFDHGRGVMHKKAIAVGLPIAVVAKVHGLSPGKDGDRARDVQKHFRISALRGN